MEDPEEEVRRLRAQVAELQHISRPVDPMGKRPTVSTPHILHGQFFVARHKVRRHRVFCQTVWTCFRQILGTPNARMVRTLRRPLHSRQAGFDWVARCECAANSSRMVRQRHRCCGTHDNREANVPLTCLQSVRTLLPSPLPSSSPLDPPSSSLFPRWNPPLPPSPPPGTPPSPLPQEKRYQIPSNCVRQKFVCHTSNFLERTCHSQICTKFHLKSILSLQDLRQSQCPQTVPTCIDVQCFPHDNIA